ncbi:MAG: hypothetical protein AB1540_07430 [Bdellovibrionota bacterium]
MIGPSHGENRIEQWIPILDYAVLTGMSTSTLRRYIKAKKIPYKIENGRYLLLADSRLAEQYAQQKSPQRRIRSNWDGVGDGIEVGPSIDNRVRELEEKLVRAQEQISELKMLVAIYEEKLAQSDH